MKRGTKLIPVRFIDKNAPYNIGEIAGFPAEVVERLIKHKKAVLYEPPEAELSPKGDGIDYNDDVAVDEKPDMVVPVHDKGPYFMVGEERVKGKKAAQKLADEINAAAEE